MIKRLCAATRPSRTYGAAEDKQVRCCKVAIEHSPFCRIHADTTLLGLVTREHQLKEELALVQSAIRKHPETNAV